MLDLTSSIWQRQSGRPRPQIIPKRVILSHRPEPEFHSSNRFTTTTTGKMEKMFYHSHLLTQSCPTIGYNFLGLNMNFYAGTYLGQRSQKSDKPIKTTNAFDPSLHTDEGISFWKCLVLGSIFNFFIQMSKNDLKPFLTNKYINRKIWKLRRISPLYTEFMHSRFLNKTELLPRYQLNNRSL